MIYSLVMKLRVRYRLFSQMSELLHWQSLLIEAKDLEIAELQRAVLANQQAFRDLAVAFRIAAEQPEIDLREDLDALIRDLSDQLCVLEEHVT